MLFRSVVTKTIDGQIHEPMESTTIDVPECPRTAPSVGRHAPPFVSVTEGVEPPQGPHGTPPLGRDGGNLPALRVLSAKVQG